MTPIFPLKSIRYWLSETIPSWDFSAVDDYDYFTGDGNVPVSNLDSYFERGQTVIAQHCRLPLLIVLHVTGDSGQCTVEYRTMRTKQIELRNNHLEA